MRRIEPPPAWAERLVIITDTVFLEMEEILTPDERAVASQFPLEKRRLEWTAARAAAKILAIEQHIVTSPHDCVVDRNEYGRPSLRAGDRHLHLSLSHSSGAAAALIGERPVGVDLQAHRVIDRRATKFFLDDDEDIPADVRGEQLIHLWAAKEASWKASGAGGSTLRSIRLEEFTQVRNGFASRYRSREGLHGLVETFTLPDGFVLALAEGLLP